VSVESGDETVSFADLRAWVSRAISSDDRVRFIKEMLIAALYREHHDIASGSVDQGGVARGPLPFTAEGSRRMAGSQSRTRQHQTDDGYGRPAHRAAGLPAVPAASGRQHLRRRAHEDT
jgi:hypothetical protein